jgi:hypothetical protein
MWTDITRVQSSRLRRMPQLVKPAKEGFMVQVGSNGLSCRELFQEKILHKSHFGFIIQHAFNKVFKNRFPTSNYCLSQVVYNLWTIVPV